MFYNIAMNKEFDFLQLNKLLNNLTDGIVLTDISGIVLFCNDTAAANYGISKYSLTGTSIETLVEKQLVDQSFNQLAASTGKPVTYEQICKSKKQLINKTIPVFDKKQKLEFIIEQTYCVDELAFESNNKISDSPVIKQAAVPQPTVPENNLITEFKSKAMTQVYSLADNMAPKNINILILGPSGTGKSCLAKRIHDNSTRKNGPFVTINCSTIPENLIESELFGYMKGAFSGASDRGKQGLVELADGGTLFLDEIGEIPLSLQAKLLQLVQDKTYLPVGGVQPKQVDTRIIAATNKNLFLQVKDGVFREDLYYRLAVVTITMPALKGRYEDIDLLIHHFTHIFNHKHKTDAVFSKKAMELMLDYSWPGNVRELEHLIEFLILNADEGYITPQMLPSQIIKESVHPQHDGSFTPASDFISVSPSVSDTSELDAVDSFDNYIESCESQLINHLYLEYNNSYKLADRLKISQSKANRLIRKYVKK